MTDNQREYVLVSSILDDPHAKLGPKACTALAFWRYWSSPVASKLGEAIGKVIGRGKVPSRAMVKAVLEKDYRPWVDHPTFKDMLPMLCVEDLADQMLPLYEGIRLKWMIGFAYEECKSKPHKATDIARDLKVQLEGVLL
jgi:hypothetical protein